MSHSSNIFGNCLTRWSQIESDDLVLGVDSAHTNRQVGLVRRSLSPAWQTPLQTPLLPHHRLGSILPTMKKLELATNLPPRERAGGGNPNGRKPPHKLVPTAYRVVGRLDFLPGKTDTNDTRFSEPGHVFPTSQAALASGLTIIKRQNFYIGLTKLLPAPEHTFSF